DVAVESTPDEGSRFMVTLRFAEAVHLPAPAAESGPLATPVLTLRPDAVRLLVVDDHPVNLELMLRQLELLGLSADIAEDGAAGLALWRNAHHSVVLMDL